MQHAARGLPTAFQLDGLEPYASAGANTLQANGFKPTARAVLEHLATLAAEPADQRAETEGLAAENNRLAVALEEQSRSMDHLALEKASAEGQVVQLRAESDRLREEVSDTHQAAEQATAVVTALKADLESRQTMYYQNTPLQLLHGGARNPQHR